MTLENDYKCHNLSLLMRSELDFAEVECSINTNTKLHINQTRIPLQSIETRNSVYMDYSQ